MLEDARIESSRLSSPDAFRLIRALNEELTATYPEEGANHFDLSEEETSHGRGVFLIAYRAQDAIGCGALRLVGPSEAEIKRMFVVAVSTIVGFATYEAFRGEGKWPGYSSTAELSIHVRESHWGQGIGRGLIETLIERGRLAGIHVLVAGIDAGNEASFQFHRRLGFEEVARMPEIGQKFGRWLDLVLMQLILDSRTRP